MADLICFIVDVLFVVVVRCRLMACDTLWYVINVQVNKNNNVDKYRCKIKSRMSCNYLFELHKSMCMNDLN